MTTFDSSKVVQNVLFLGSGEIASRVVAFLGITYLTRVLGPTAFGIVGFAAAFCGYLSLAISGGFDEVGAREVARRPRDASALAASVILIRLMLALAALTALGIIVLFLDKPATLKFVLILTALSFFPMALDTSWVHKGLEQNRRVSLALVLGQTLYVGALLLVVRGPEDVALVPVAQTLGDLSAALLLAGFVFWAQKVTLDWREGLKLAKSSSIRAASRLCRMLLFTFGVVLLGFLAGERAVGIYSAGYRFCLLPLAVAAAIHVSYLPGLTRALTLGVRQCAELASRALELSAAIGIPIAAGGIILAVPLLRTLFGPEYAEGATAFRFLLLGIGFIFINAVARNVLLVGDRLKTDLWIVGSGAGLNVALNVLLIPRYGLAGAGFAVAAAEGLILILGILAIHQIGVRLSMDRLLRPLAAAAVMGMVLAALGPGRGLLLYSVAGLIAYVSALIVFRGMPEDVQAYLRKMGAAPKALSGRSHP